MVCLRNSLSFTTRLIPTTHSSPPLPPGNGVSVWRNSLLGRRQTNQRGISVVTRAGPSTTSYIFAFVFPLSLLAVTIFTSARIADKLDQKFFEELVVDQAILEGEDNDDEISSSPNRETAPIRSRNRPKREVESSSK